MSWRARARVFKKKREINRRGRGLKKKNLSVKQNKKRRGIKGKQAKSLTITFFPLEGK